jgi:hypothetical protein
MLRRTMLGRIMLGRIIAILALSGAMAGFVTSLLLPRRYVGRASLSVDPSELVDRAAERVLATQPLSAMIQGSPYYKDMLDYTPMPELLQQVRDNVVIERNATGDCVVQFTEDDEFAARNMTNRMVEELRRNLENSSIKLPVRVGTTGPSRALCALEGLMAGLLVGLCVWFGLSRDQD